VSVRRAMVTALLLAACTETVQVLQPEADARPSADAAGVATCAQAFASDSGAACEPGLSCERPDPDQLCCTELAVCLEGGVLQRSLSCACGACVDDGGCEPGVQVCDGNACVDCPTAETCDACPAGLIWLERNGCTTCVCAPPTECTSTGSCDVGECVRGARCSDGCPEGDFGCCASVCDVDPAECVAPAPLGCDVPCDVVDDTCGNCVTVDCVCDAGAWTCGQICVGDLAPTCAF